MSVYLRCLKSKQLLHVHKVLAINRQNQARISHWFPDYIPGPMPKTEKERNEAAKKYNLLPEEYKPYPDDERGCGDYPDIPITSVDDKDPYYPWDMPDLRRDFNEPINDKMMLYLPELISTKVDKKKRRLMALYFVLGSSAALSFFYLISFIICISPLSEKQYPAPDVVHYTFELDKDKMFGKKKKKCSEEDEYDEQ